MTDTIENTGNVAPKPGEGKEAPKTEVSASTVARMMGVATQTEMKLLEGKIDLLTTKVNAFTAKVDRIQASLSSIPTNSDLDRIDINISGLKTMLREMADGIGSHSGESAEAAEQGRKLRAGIKTNTQKPEAAAVEE